MTMLVYSIFDEKAAVFGVPFFMKNKGIALRAFGDLIKDGNTSINKHPDDFKLYYLGEFDDNSGSLVSCKQPEFIAHAVDFVTT